MQKLWDAKLGNYVEAATVPCKRPEPSFRECYRASLGHVSGVYTSHCYFSQADPTDMDPTYIYLLKEFNKARTLSVYIYTYMYVYIHICILCIYIYIHENPQFKALLLSLKLTGSYVQGLRLTGSIVFRFKHSLYV